MVHNANMIYRLFIQKRLAEAASGNFILAEIAIMQILTLFITSAANYVVVLNNTLNIFLGSGVSTKYHPALSVFDMNNKL